MKNIIKICLALFSTIMIIGCRAELQEQEEIATIPQISAVSDDIAVSLNKDIKISVSATSADSGKLSYKWYCTVDKLSKGEEILDNNKKELKPDTSFVGVRYYYCIVTNTLGTIRARLI